MTTEILPFEKLEKKRFALNNDGFETIFAGLSFFEKTGSFWSRLKTFAWRKKICLVIAI